MKFGVGIIGATGYIGTPYRDEIRDCPDARIIAVSARRQNLLDQAAAKDGAILATQHWQEVVDHPDVNVVVVATPDALHHEQVLRAAESGKHVVCEKPVAADATQAQEMVHAYQQHGLAHFVPFWTRYVPLFVRAKEIHAAGDLGEIRALVYRWHNPRPISMPFTWRDDATQSAAGSIADVGSHAYDAICWMIGQEATNVRCDATVLTPGKPDLGEINLEEALNWGERHSHRDATATRAATAYDYASISFDLERGAKGTLVLSHTPFLRKGLAPEIELHGTEASLALDRVRNELSIFKEDPLNPECEVVETPRPSNRFREFVFPALARQIRGEFSNHPNLEDGWRVQLFTDAAVRSATNGRRESLKS